VIRVFIIAASALARSSLETLVSRRDVKVVGSAENFDSLAEQFAEGGADVLLIDAPREQEASTLDSLKSAEIAEELPVVLLAENASTESFADALRAGVRAVLPPDVSRDQLFAALQAAVAGLVVLHPQEVSEAFPARAPLAQTVSELAEPLTRREREVLQMLAGGLANKEIAARLNISDHTVKFHVASVLGKLGAASRTEAVALGIRRGLILL
jgi:two-component system, NarL family, response regulator YdfI